MVKKKDEGSSRKSSRRSADGRGRESRARRSDPYPMELRLQAVREVEEKKATQATIARSLGISLSTLQVWVTAYRAGGIDALKGPRSGPRGQGKKAATRAAHKKAVIATKEA